MTVVYKFILVLPISCWELWYYLVDVLASLNAAGGGKQFHRPNSPPPVLSIEQDPKFRVLQSTVDVREALKLYTEDIVLVYIDTVYTYSVVHLFQALLIQKSC